MTFQAEHLAGLHGITILYLWPIKTRLRITSFLQATSHDEISRGTIYKPGLVS